MMLAAYPGYFMLSIGILFLIKILLLCKILVYVSELAHPMLELIY